MSIERLFINQTYYRIPSCPETCTLELKAAFLEVRKVSGSPNSSENPLNSSYLVHIERSNGTCFPFEISPNKWKTMEKHRHDALFDQEVTEPHPIKNVTCFMGSVHQNILTGAPFSGNDGQYMASLILEFDIHRDGNLLA